jgi:glutathione S-transferase
MLKLHYFPGSANLTPHMVLHELGLPFELVLVDRDKNAHRSEAYLKINPHGRIPTLVDGDLVIYETAAITMHLVDRHPEAGLAPAVGSPARAHFYQWMVYLSNTLQAAMHTYFYTEQYAKSPAVIEEVRACSETRMLEMFRILDAQLGDKPYVLGDTLSAADHYLFMLTRWGRNMQTPPRTLPRLGRHAERMLARPAVLRALHGEGLSTPYF